MGGEEGEGVVATVSKISAEMHRRWQDLDLRQRMLAGLAKAKEATRNRHPRTAAEIVIRVSRANKLKRLEG